MPTPMPIDITDTLNLASDMFNGLFGPLFAGIGGIALGLALMGMVLNMITRVVRDGGSLEEPAIDEELIDKEYADEEPEYEEDIEPEPVVPEWEISCRYCGTGFDGEEKQCKHCGGKRARLNPNI